MTLDFSLNFSSILLNLFMKWPASRKHEVCQQSLLFKVYYLTILQAEADYIGLMMMAQGCYRPEAAMEMWNRMEKADKQGVPQMLSTHPSNHNREQSIREWLPKAHEKADGSDCRAMANYGKSTM